MADRWPEARVNVLRNMWGKHPPSGIAERLSTTRCAIIGKADRLGLRGDGSLNAPKRKTMTDEERAAKNAKRRAEYEPKRSRNGTSEFLFAKPKRAAKPGPRIVIPRRRVAPVVAYTGEPVRQEGIKPAQCRYIVGNERGGADVLMCGDHAALGEPYCATHRARMWTGFKARLPADPTEASARNLTATLMRR